MTEQELIELKERIALLAVGVSEEADIAATDAAGRAQRVWPEDTENHRMCRHAFREGAAWNATDPGKLTPQMFTPAECDFLLNAINAHVGQTAWSCGHFAGAVCAECHLELIRRANAIAAENVRLREEIELVSK